MNPHMLEEVILATTWKNHEGHMLNEIIHTEEDKCYTVSHACRIQLVKRIEIKNRLAVAMGWKVGTMVDIGQSLQTFCYLMN